MICKIHLPGEISSDQWGCARALEFMVRFFAVLNKTATGWNDQILRRLQNGNHDNQFFFYLFQMFLPVRNSISWWF